jgi:DNA-binding MarR family transcriptional regulator
MAGPLTHLATRSGTPEDLLLESLHEAARAFRHRVGSEVEREGLSIPMFWALHHVVLEGPMNVGQIAEACIVTSAGISAAVDDLERAGLVARERSSKDRRIVVLSVTPRGRTVHRSVWTRVARQIAAALERTPASEVRIAARVLKRFAEVTVHPSVRPGGVLA